MKLHASELARALRALDAPEADPFVRNPDGTFTVRVPANYGGYIERTTTPEELATLLPQACAWTGYDAQEVADWLSGLVPDGWDPDRHSLGAVIDRRTRAIEGLAFWGGSSTYEVTEVLVRVDNPPEFVPDSVSERVEPARSDWEPIQTGDVIWVRADRLQSMPPVVLPVGE